MDTESDLRQKLLRALEDRNTALANLDAMELVMLRYKRWAFKLKDRLSESDADREAALEMAANANAACNALYQGSCALRADRDEWMQQHENAVACWYEERDRLHAEVERMRAERDEAEGALTAFMLRVIVENDMNESERVRSEKLRTISNIAEEALGHDHVQRG